MQYDNSHEPQLYLSGGDLDNYNITIFLIAITLHYLDCNLFLSILKYPVDYRQTCMNFSFYIIKHYIALKKVQFRHKLFIHHVDSYNSCCIKYSVSPKEEQHEVINPSAVLSCCLHHWIDRLFKLLTNLCLLLINSCEHVNVLK